MSSPAQAAFDTEVEISVETLAKRHIFVPPGKDLYYSRINIVIGPNGAGKTRFLKAVRDSYIEYQKADILYSYFPDLSPDGDNISSYDLPDYSLEEFMESNDVSFNDFFKEIESQYGSFLTDILNPKSKKRAQNYKQFLTVLKETFLAFAGKTIVPKGHSIPDGGQNVNPRLVVEDPQRREVLPLEQALKDFSPGERILFYMSLFLALRKDPEEGREQAIILDEPEAHLHPDALIKFVKGLEEKFPKADIWIATHSLYLLSLYKFENIVYLENSKLVHHDSKLYSKILSSMLGPYVTNIQEFFASLPQWQYCEFIAECFTNPEVVDIPDPADPQVQIFIKAMREKKLRKILDYGGGSGRLGRSVEAANAQEWENLEYHIFDIVKRDAGEGIKVFDKLRDADSDYDCAVMMNVLHEMDPGEWRKTFINLYSRICADGCLLFVEADALSSGEYPNDAGYFLLRPGELRTLFNLKNDPMEISVEKEGKKYCGYLIPRSALNTVTNQSVADAIRILELRTLLGIKGIRAQGQDKANSRRYAFLLQQHMNAMLYLEKWGKEAAQPAAADSPPKRFPPL